MNLNQLLCNPEAIKGLTTRGFEPNFCTPVVIKGLVTCGFEPIRDPVSIGGLITRDFEPIDLYPGSDRGSNNSWF